MASRARWTVRREWVAARIDGNVGPDSDEPSRPQRAREWTRCAMADGETKTVVRGGWPGRRRPENAAASVARNATLDEDPLSAFTSKRLRGCCRITRTL